MSKSFEAEHYDRVTNSWMRWVMGNDLHFGLFEGKATLGEATQRLTTTMMGLLDLQAGLRVLDVGCGVGTTAMRLAQEAEVEVLGISTSASGIALAEQRLAEHPAKARVTFREADAMDNRLPDASFDRVLLLESVHMMPDKQAVMRECFRVLRPGGVLALCDVCSVSSFGNHMVYYVGLGHSPAVAGRMRDEMNELMRRVFGLARVDNQNSYLDAVEQAGFQNIKIEDISAATRATLEHWASNALDNEAELSSELGPEYLHELMLALLQMSMSWGDLSGYITLTANKAI